MKINKKIIFIFVIILFVFIGIIIYKNMTKKSKYGNNMNSQEIVDNILNINSYKSKITVQVNSNKNKNKYILEQEYNTENGSIQTVLEPANIAGIKIINKENLLTIQNTKLNLSKIFDDYQGLEDNCLDLVTFINSYKNSEKSKYDENDTEIIMKTKSDSNTQNSNNKILYINKGTKLPTKMIIEDNNQNTKIFIQYNEINFN